MKTARTSTMLRRAIRKGTVVMPGAFNAATARLIERAGFPAAYVSGAGLANATAGVPDIGLLTRKEVVQLAGYIVRAVNIPVLCDADTGFGGPGEAARTVRAFEEAGLAGLHLEDQRFPKRCGHLPGKELIAVREMTAKIRSAVRARRDPDFLIVARTDARSVDGFEAAVARAHSYLEAGADAIFPEALETEREFRDFAQHVSAPLMANMTEFGRSPLLSVARLSALGYRMVLFPLTAFRIAMRAEEKCLNELQRLGTQKRAVGRMLTRQELYDLLGYDPNRPDVWAGGKA